MLLDQYVSTINGSVGISLVNEFRVMDPPNTSSSSPMPNDRVNILYPNESGESSSDGLQLDLIDELIESEQKRER